MTESMNSKVPKIRFKGFEGDWVEKKIESICSISTGKSNTQDRVSDGIYPFYVRSAVVERSNRYLYDEEAVLTVGDGVGTGKVFHYVNGKYDLHQRVYRMHSFTEGVDAVFFFHFFSNHFYKRVMAMTAKTSVDSVRLEMISQMDFRHSSKAEQTQIGGYFRELDRLIGLQQRKHAKLVTLKKAMLQKMFPKPGSTTPEIRFKGFEGDWVEKALVKVADVFDGTHQTPRYTNAGVMFLSVENIHSLRSSKFISKEDFRSEFKIFPLKGDVLMTRIGDIGTANVVETDEPVAYYVSLALLKPKFADPYFLKYSISSDSVRKALFHRTLHIAFPKKINKNEIEKVEMQTPDSTTEQQKIGNYFRTLDEVISKHALQLEKLKQIKAACLEKMFV